MHLHLFPQFFIALLLIFFFFYAWRDPIHFVQKQQHQNDESGAHQTGLGSGSVFQRGSHQRRPPHVVVNGRRGCHLVDDGRLHSTTESFRQQAGKGKARVDNLQLQEEKSGSTLHHWRHVLCTSKLFQVSVQVLAFFKTWTNLDKHLGDQIWPNIQMMKL